MRSLKLALAALLGLTTMSALAQSPPVTDTGIRAGHTPGVGESLPKSDHASNIAPADTKSPLAPTLPASAAGDAADPLDYLHAARVALVAGHTGEAQQSLEMAETRLLDRQLAPGASARPSDSRLVSQVRDALGALGIGAISETIAMIDLILAS